MGTANATGTAAFAARIDHVHQGATGGIVVRETDGSPSGTATVLKFPNDAVTFSGGTALISTAGTTTATIIVQDQGTTIGTASVLNFTGSGRTASFSGGTAMVDRSGGSATAVTGNVLVALRPGFDRDPPETVVHSADLGVLFL